MVGVEQRSPSVRVSAMPRGLRLGFCRTVFEDLEAGSHYGPLVLVAGCIGAAGSVRRAFEVGLLRASRRDQELLQQLLPRCFGGQLGDEQCLGFLGAFAVAERLRFDVLACYYATGVFAREIGGVPLMRRKGV